MNDERSTIEALDFLVKYIRPPSESESIETSREDSNDSGESFILVHGNCIDAYVCINGLIQIGIPGERIIHLRPTVKSVSEDSFVFLGK